MFWLDLTHVQHDVSPDMLWMIEDTFRLTRTYKNLHILYILQGMI